MEIKVEEIKIEAKVEADVEVNREAKEEVFLVLQSMINLKLDVTIVINMSIIDLHVGKNKMKKKMMVLFLFM